MYRPERVSEISHDLAAVVDPEGPVLLAPGTLIKVNVPPVSTKAPREDSPTIWPLSLIPRVSVPPAPGTSMVVNE
jgi:hypothetical protein